MRIAWFSPFPPVRTGVADCSAELVAALRRRGHHIDPYPAEAAHDFPWRHRQRPYDLIVYQFGNSSHHDYAWAYAFRYPGLVVLHDACLHHARAAFLLRERRTADYRAEFAWSHPDVPADAAELAIAGMDSRLFYEWPLVRGLVEASRMVATHGAASRSPLSASRSPLSASGSPLSASRSLESIRLGHGSLVTEAERARARREVRARLAIADDAVLFGVFGGLTPEKRIPHVLAAFRSTLAHAPSARLLLGGGEAAHYDVRAVIAAHGLTERVILTGYIAIGQELTDHIAACDVSLNLRWPTVGETSGAWLRALAAGVPTVITDLAHLGGVPSLDPRTWQTRFVVRGSKDDERPRASNLEPRPAACVAIDIVDEDHSLRLAMRRLALDADLRAQLGRDGQAWWTREHSLEAMVDDYERLMPEAAARPDPVVTLPPHMRDEGDRQLNRLLAPFGIEGGLVRRSLGGGG